MLARDEARVSGDHETDVFLNGKWQSGHFRNSENVLEYRAKRGMRDLNLPRLLPKHLEAMDKEIYKQPWFVYIAECKGSTLYTGVAKDVDKRINEHNTTGDCRYTRFRKPLKLIYQERCEDYNSARRRELEIKRFSRKKKLTLALSQV